MKKITILLGIVLLTGFGSLVVFAQSEQPPGFPTIGDTSTVTDAATVESTVTVVETVTPTLVTVQTATDDAETGPEIYILAGLSLLGGLGIFFIKKYFDLKKFNI